MTRRVLYSFANTPLKAAHAPLEMASASHADLVFGADMATPLFCYCGSGDEAQSNVEVDSRVDWYQDRVGDLQGTDALRTDPSWKTWGSCAQLLASHDSGHEACAHTHTHKGARICNAERMNEHRLSHSKVTLGHDASKTGK